MHPHFLSFQLCVLLKKPKAKSYDVSFVLPVYSWLCGLPWKHGPPTMYHTLRENRLFIFQEQSFAIMSSTRDGTSMTTFPLHAGFYFILFIFLAWASAGHLHAVETIVNSCGGLPCEVQKGPIPCVHSCALTLTVLPSSFFCNNIRGLGGEGVMQMSILGLGILQSVILCILTSYEYLCKLSLLQKEISLIRVERSINLGW